MIRCFGSKNYKKWFGLMILALGLCLPQTLSAVQFTPINPVQVEAPWPRIHVPGDFPTIQEAIDAARDGMEVVVARGLYEEAQITFRGKKITVRSENPLDFNVVAATIVASDTQSLFIFNSGEDKNSILSGLTLVNQTNYQLECDGSSPALRNMMLVSNLSLGGSHFLLRNGSKPITSNVRFFTRDDVPPEVNITSPVDGSFTNQTTMTVTGTIDDPSASVLVNDLEAQVDPRTLTFTATQIPIQPNQANIIEAVAFDQSLNSSNDSVIVTYDGILPIISSLIPQEGAIVTETNPTLKGSYSDNASGIDLEKVAMLLNAVDVTADAQVLTPTNIEVPVLTPLTEGDHRVELRVQDRAGNLTTQDNNFLVDISPPLIFLDQPLQRNFTNATPTIIISYTDTFSGVDITTLEVKINGVDRTAEFVIEPEHATLEISPSDPLPEGITTIHAQIKDIAGFQGNLDTTFLVDALPPEVNISQPLDGALIDAPRVNVQGAVTEANILKQITVNGIKAYVNGNTFEALNIPLVEGENIITARAQDIAGNSGEDSVTITATIPAQESVLLEAAPLAGFTPLDVNFSVVSNAPGIFQEIRYDFEGDGIADMNRNDLNPIAHTYTAAGEYLPVVTVVTDEGSFSSPGGYNHNPVFQEGAPVHIVVSEPFINLEQINITDPVDMKTTQDGSLYVLSRSTATLTQFDSAHNVVRSVTDLGNTPTGIDVDSSGNVYVAISGDHQIAKLIPAGETFVFNLSFGNQGTGKIGSQGSGDGQFNSPYDIALSADGKFLFICDTNNHRIQEFTSTGVFIDKFGSLGSGWGQFNSPKGITLDSDEQFLVSDFGNNRIAIMRDLSFEETFGVQGPGPGQFAGVQNLGSNSRGTYVADTGNNRIQKLTASEEGHWDINQRQPIWELGSDLALSGPYGVAPVFDFLKEVLYIADTGSNRVLKVMIPQSTPEATWEAMKTDLLNQDLEAALSKFSPATQQRYREIFYAIGAEGMAQTAAEMESITPIFIEASSAEYRIDQDIDGVIVTSVIHFVFSGNQWLIFEF